MPGFNDAHLHLSGGGFEKMQVDLVGTKSLAEMKERISEHARAVRLSTNETIGIVRSRCGRISSHTRRLPATRVSWSHPSANCAAMNLISPE